ncbi:MAG: hypothetical protein ACLFWD_10635 [Anaerolineales bacterium]
MLPGAVDPHVHLDMPLGETRSSDDCGSGTQAALIGGTTTLIDFVEPAPGQYLVEAFRDRRWLAEQKAAIDFSLHMTLTSAGPEIVQQLPSVFEAGMTSFKMYTTYEGFRLDDRSLLDLLEAVSSIGGLPIIHAESDAIVSAWAEKMLEAAKDSPASYPRSRPSIAEVEAIQRVLALNEAVRA